MTRPHIETLFTVNLGGDIPRVITVRPNIPGSKEVEMLNPHHVKTLTSYEASLLAEALIRASEIADPTLDT